MTKARGRIKDKVDYEPITNPIDGERVSGKVSRYIRKVRRVRNNARRAMRSGNPAKRAEAARVFTQAPRLIVESYNQDWADRNKEDYSPDITS